jgi:SAM-dependent methyltransferase
VTDPKKIVERGYDAIADRFDVWRQRIEGSPELEWAEDLLARLPEDPDLLELGSGGARGPTQKLAKAGRLIGVDISIEQVKAAERRCPDASFLHGDMTEIELEPESFDAVVSVYVFNHVPRRDLPTLVERCASWLRPGGYLLASFGRSGGEGIEDDWLGVPMFFASYSEQETLDFVRRAGLTIERSEVVPIIEPEAEVGNFLWVLARKPPSRRRGLPVRSRGEPAAPRARAAPPRPQSRGSGVPRGPVPK